jgi:hypothetical protein
LPIIVLLSSSIIALGSIFFNYLIPNNLIPVKEVPAYGQDSTTHMDGSYAKFIDPINLSKNMRDSVYGQVAAYGKNVYVAWEEDKKTATSANNANYQSHDNRNYDIYFKKSKDGGVTFSKAINLSNNSGFSEHPQIAVSGSDVYIAWTDSTSMKKEILFRMSSDEGNSFGKIIKLSNSSLESYNQEIAAFANNVYVVWEDNNSSSIVLKASTDRGNTFKDTKTITNNGAERAEVGETYPKIAAYGNNVYLVWNVGMPPYTFKDGDNNEDNNETNSKDPRGEEQHQGIFFTKSSDNGDNFGNIVKLNNQASPVGESQIAAFGDQVYIVWSGNSDNLIPNDLFFIKSIDKGNSFTYETILSKKSSLNAELAVYGNNLYVLWQDFLKGKTNNNNQEILIKMSNDGGDIFTDIIKNISHNKGVSECPSIAVSQNILYLVWEDDTLGNHEIFFTRSDNQYKLS